MKRNIFISILFLSASMLAIFNGCTRTTSTSDFIGKYQAITCQYCEVRPKTSMFAFNPFSGNSHKRTDGYYCYELVPFKINIFKDVADGKIKGHIDATIFDKDNYSGQMDRFTANLDVTSFQLEKDTLILNITNDLVASFTIAMYKENGQTIIGLPIKLTYNSMETFDSPFYLKNDKNYLYYKNMTDEKLVNENKLKYYKLIIFKKKEEIKKEKSMNEIERLENTISRLESNVK